MNSTGEKRHFEVDWTVCVVADCASGALPSPPVPLHWRETDFELYWKYCFESWTLGKWWEARYLEDHCSED